MDRVPGRRGSVNEAIAEALVSVPAERTGELFEELYRRTFPRVYAYVASLLRDRSAAEEVTAQAFERAYRRRSSYRPRRGTQEAWLFGIARNAALDELRRLKRRAPLEAEPEDDSAPAPEDHAEASCGARPCAPRWRSSTRASATSWR
jgi:DNA-directed RNA polymerase specialized sigma24 family protein